MKKENKCYWLFRVWWLLIFSIPVTAKQHSKVQLESEKQMLLKRVKTIQNILRTTAVKKKESIGRLNALSIQIESNALLMQTISQELCMLNQEILQRQKNIGTLTHGLVQLQKEYATMVYIGHKALHGIHLWMFILSSPSFHRLVQRLRYIKQYTRIRHNHFREIETTKASLKAQQQTAQERIRAKADLLRQRQTERHKLIGLRAEQVQLTGKLTAQHTLLVSELQQHNKSVKRLDRLIKAIIQRELDAQTATPSIQHDLPSERLTILFSKKKGKLPWPVKAGFISGKFGIIPHPVLRGVKIENLGIDIQTSKGMQAYAIFEGVVKAIAFVPGMNQVVIIQHGAYHSVYARLKETNVKVGQKVQAHAPIGIIYTNTQGISQLQLQLWKDTQKLNPTQWLSRR